MIGVKTESTKMVTIEDACGLLEACFTQNTVSHTENSVIQGLTGARVAQSPTVPGD